LVFTQHYVPEVTAARARLQAFCEGLAARGHEVEVITAVPNHPAGVVLEGYRGRVQHKRDVGGVEVRYLWIYARPEKTTRNRLMLYGSYAAAASLAGSLARRPDVILASSPPLPVGAVAMTVARRHRVPWLLDVRDIWPEVAVVLGELTGGRAIRAAERLERRLYRSAAGIVTTTEPFRRHIERVGAADGKVEVLMNGTTPTWLDAGAAQVPRKEIGLPDHHFVWAYAGNLGIAQAMEAAIDAAAELGDGYRLLVIGDGPRLGAIRDRAAALPADSIEFRAPMPAEDAARVLRGCDALLVPLGSQAALASFVPSKLFDFAALGRPLVVAAAGEAARLAREAGMGIEADPGDATSIATGIRRLRAEPELRARLGDAGRKFASEHRREDGAARLERMLVELAVRRELSAP
jgi:glycosyltransferase involved in cell wall biosynthesis